MAGRHVDTHGNVHEAAGVIDTAGQFVARPAAEQAAGALYNRSKVSVARTDMAILMTEAHLEEAATSVRSSWATKHSGSKSDQVFWAKQSLDSAVAAQGEALERAEQLGDQKTPLQTQQLEANALELEKLTRWVESADGKAKAAVERSAELQATFDARKSAAAVPTGPDGSIDHPVNHDDPRLTAGEVFDTIENPEWGIFHRRRDGVFPREPYAFRVQADRELGPEELSQLAKILGSAYKTTGWNEGLGWPEQDTPFSFIVSADTTKGRAYQNLGNLEENLADYLVSGSPPAKTNRSKTLKMGERYVEGFGDNAPKIELYYEGAPFISKA